MTAQPKYLRMVYENEGDNYDCDEVSLNPILTIDLIRQFKEQVSFSWKDLSKNKCITLDIAKNNPDLPCELGESAKGVK